MDQKTRGQDAYETGNRFLLARGVPGAELLPWSELSARDQEYWEVISFEITRLAGKSSSAERP